MARTRQLAWRALAALALAVAVLAAPPWQAQAKDLDEPDTRPAADFGEPAAAEPAAEPEPKMRLEDVETRAEAVVYSLQKYDLLCPLVDKHPTFSDVPDDHEHKFAIGCGAWHGIVLGFDDGTFRPDEPVTDQQFLDIRRRAFWASEP